MLAGVVNRLPDDLLRRVLVVLAEELFNSIFRDYGFAYDPRDEMWPPEGCGIRPGAPGRAASHQPPRPPRLCEESLANAVPYSAVVQSLRDAAKDAIMRRLELEARCSCMVHASNGDEREALPQLETPATADNASTSTVASRAAPSPTHARSSEGLRAGEEVQLREELRHARVLADTYQARTLELERERIELEEEVRRTRSERERDDARRQKLSEEVRRLRAETDTARASRGTYEADRAALQDRSFASSSAAGSVRGTQTARPAPGGVSSRRGLTDRRLAPMEKPPSGSGGVASTRSSGATSNQAAAESGPTSPQIPPGTPNAEDHGSSRAVGSSHLGHPEDDVRLRTGLGNGSTKNAISARSLRTPRERFSLGNGANGGSSTNVSVASAGNAPLNQAARQDSAADAAAGGRLRRTSAGNSRTVLEATALGGAGGVGAVGGGSLLGGARALGVAGNSPLATARPGKANSHPGGWR